MHDLDFLDQQLQTKADGANIHTINKASFYLKVVKKRPADDPARTAFVALVGAALATNDWSPLKKHMASWW